MFSSKVKYPWGRRQLMVVCWGRWNCSLRKVSPERASAAGRCLSETEGGEGRVTVTEVWWVGSEVRRPLSPCWVWMWCSTEYNRGRAAEHACRQLKFHFNNHQPHKLLLFAALQVDYGMYVCFQMFYELFPCRVREKGKLCPDTGPLAIQTFQATQHLSFLRHLTSKSMTSWKLPMGGQRYLAVLNGKAEAGWCTEPWDLIPSRTNQLRSSLTFWPSHELFFNAPPPNVTYIVSKAWKLKCSILLPSVIYYSCFITQQQPRHHFSWINFSHNRSLLFCSIYWINFAPFSQHRQLCLCSFIPV